jgi:Nidogen-like
MRTNNRFSLCLAVVLVLTLLCSRAPSKLSADSGPSPAHRVIVFLQGIGSQLKHPTPNSTYYVEGLNAHCGNTTLLPSQYSGQYFSCIKESLLSEGYSVSDFLEFSYTGGDVDASGNWVPNEYRCDQTGGTSLENSATTLGLMLSRYGSAHPGTRFALVGHSLGGDVAFQELSDLVSRSSSLLVSIDSVLTLDSQLDGYASANGLLRQLLPCGGVGPGIDDLSHRALDIFIRNENAQVITNAHTQQQSIKVYTLGNQWDTLLSDSLGLAVHQSVDNADDKTLFDIHCDDLPSLSEPGCGHNLPLSDSTAVEKIISLIGAQSSAVLTLPKSDGTDACQDRSLLANDDGSTGAVPLPFTANFFGNSYGAVFINNNGNVTFNGPQSTYTPYPLLTTHIPIIAPFFADMDTRGTGSSPVTYSYGDGVYAGHPTLCVDWVNVGYYSGHTDKLNSVQLLLIDRSDTGPGNFDIMFNYNQIQWETGDVSGGSGGLGGSCARVGYSNGTSTSFELPGSAVCGSFVDSNPSGLIHGSLNSTQPGRYIFAVRNGVAPHGGTISGHVFANSNNPANALSGAFVQVCSATNCNNTLTDATGNYTVSGLADGSYTATAFPPGGTSLFQNSVSNLVIAGANMLTGQDIVLQGPAPLPNGTTITNRYVNPSGIPVIYWQDQLTLTTQGCTGGTGSYQIALADGTIARSGGMAESPSGTYTATIAPLYPNHGDAHVAITITCHSGPPTNTAFDIYIDPSGTVQTVGGAPVVGATVTLYRSDSSSGPFAPVPNGSGIMSVANRNNPDTTDANGHFGWDVIAGFYRVRAARAGCVSPTDPTQPYVDSAVLSVPPAVTNLVLTLNCNTDSTPPTTTASASSQPDTAGWNNSDVTVALLATDDPGGSGVAQSYYAVDNAACTSSNVSSCSIYTGSPVPVSGDGIHTVTFFSKDNAGNVEAAKTVTVKIDKTPPTITFAGRTPTNSFGWNNTDVTVTWDCADSLSGPVTSTVSQTLTQVGANQSVTGTCVDHAGNTASDTRTSINIDKTAPTVLPSPSRGADSNGWYNHVFAVAWVGTDSLSGIAACSTASRYVGPDTARGSLTGMCTDKAGNTARASYSFRYDATRPMVTCSITPATIWPPNHKMVPVAATVTVADALSGPAGFRLVSATANEGNPATDIQSFSPGSSSTKGYVRAERLGTGNGRIYTLTYQGRDVAGNTKTCSATVTVPHDQGH